MGILRTIQNGFGDIRSQERERDDATHIALVQSGLPGRQRAFPASPARLCCTRLTALAVTLEEVFCSMLHLLRLQ